MICLSLGKQGCTVCLAIYLQQGFAKRIDFTDTAGYSWINIDLNIDTSKYDEELRSFQGGFNTL
jgi:hypothetical protein